MREKDFVRVLRKWMYVLENYKGFKLCMSADKTIINNMGV